MLSAKSESDITSLAPSSPSRSPKRPVYYVQSPSRDSHDGDKSSSMQATPISNSPMESPSHPSFGRHSRNSSASRFSGIFRSSSGRKGGGGGSRKRNEKGWPECNVILEEGSYDDLKELAFTRRLQALMALFGFVVIFTVFCLIIWGASRPFNTEITVKSLTVHNLYIGEGSDFTGVPTKLLTVNGSLRINIYNPATFFGIHVHSTPINLVFSDITVASGQCVILIITAEEILSAKKKSQGCISEVRRKQGSTIRCRIKHNPFPNRSSSSSYSQLSNKFKRQCGGETSEDKALQANHLSLDH
ncbi:late embryogenesis abundant protein [Senna tora]|uniref:Late embryogenesis abundant protein n=1 Tax=Senna tora TaxID=362788 RepID=A0A834TC28_9FABA|nr:late embryogenesis abundant protein [Senna tora]